MNEINIERALDWYSARLETERWVAEKINEELGVTDWDVALFMNVAIVGKIDEKSPKAWFCILFGKDTERDCLRWEVTVPMKNISDGNEGLDASETLKDFFPRMGQLLASDFFNKELREKLNGELTEVIEAVED